MERRRPNIIDEQQRMTTITLLLLSLKEYWAASPHPSVPSTTAAILGSIKDIYLTNGALAGTSLFTKLLPKAGTDRDEYENLLHGVFGTGAISVNYSYFVQELQSNKLKASRGFLHNFEKCRKPLTLLDFSRYTYFSFFVSFSYFLYFGGQTVDKTAVKKHKTGHASAGCCYKYAKEQDDVLLFCMIPPISCIIASFGRKRLISY